VVGSLLDHLTAAFASKLMALLRSTKQRGLTG
jgi:hypothetical protein